MGRTLLGREPVGVTTVLTSPAASQSDCGRGHSHWCHEPGSPKLGCFIHKGKESNLRNYQELTPRGRWGEKVVLMWGNLMMANKNPKKKKTLEERNPFRCGSVTDSEGAACLQPVHDTRRCCQCPGYITRLSRALPTSSCQSVCLGLGLFFQNCGNPLSSHAGKFQKCQE